jgi:hypothetical protein
VRAKKNTGRALKNLMRTLRVDGSWQTYLYFSFFAANMNHSFRNRNTTGGTAFLLRGSIEETQFNFNGL